MCSLLLKFDILFRVMPLAPLPFVTHFWFTFSKDWTRWTRVAAVIMTVGLIIVYNLLVINPAIVPSQDQCNSNDSDLLLDLFAPVNAKWTKSPEVVPFVATGILFTQYTLAVVLVLRFIVSNDMIWLGILTTWVASVVLTQLVNSPMSPRAINYASSLPYPVERAQLVTDHVFSIHFYLTLVYMKYLRTPWLKWIVNPALALNCGVMACFLLITFHTTTYALVAAGFGAMMLEEAPKVTVAVLKFFQKHWQRCFPPKDTKGQREMELRMREVQTQAMKPAVYAPSAAPQPTTTKETTAEDDLRALEQALDKIIPNKAKQQPADATSHEIDTVSDKEEEEEEEDPQANGQLDNL